MDTLTAIAVGFLLGVAALSIDLDRRLHKNGGVGWRGGVVIYVEDVTP